MSSARATRLTHPHLLKRYFSSGNALKLNPVPIGHRRVRQCLYQRQELKEIIDRCSADSTH